MSAFLLRADAQGYIVGGHDVQAAPGCHIPGVAALDPAITIAWPDGIPWRHEDHHVALAPRQEPAP